MSNLIMACTSISTWTSSALVYVCSKEVFSSLVISTIYHSAKASIILVSPSVCLSALSSAFQSYRPRPSVHWFVRPFHHLPLRSSVCPSVLSSTVHPSARPSYRPPVSSSVCRSVFSSARQFIRLSVLPIVRLSVRPIFCPSVRPPVSSSVCRSVLSSAHQFVRLSVHPFVGPSYRLPISSSACQIIRLSVRPIIRLSVHPSVRP